MFFKSPICHRNLAAQVFGLGCFLRTHTGLVNAAKEFCSAQRISLEPAPTDTGRDRRHQHHEKTNSIDNHSVAGYLLASRCSAHVRFSGTTGASSQHNGSNIGGLAFELRIFLDTDLGVLDPLSLADFFFTGPHQGEVQIDTIGVLPVNTFGNVQYFAPGGLITGLQFNQPAFSDITFAASIGK